MASGRACFSFCGHRVAGAFHTCRSPSSVATTQTSTTTGCRMREKKRIGIDFDNTLIDYDEVFRALACERGLIDPGFRGGKDDVRRAVRALPDGEDAWQRLQGAVYGSRIADAVLFEGAGAFLRHARAEGHDILIVSHKTEYGH